MKKLASIVIALLLHSSAALAAEPAAADSFDLGQRLAREGRWHDAQKAFEDAWSRERAPAIAAALGDAELRLGLVLPAAEHLSFALGHMNDQDPGWPDALFDLVEARRYVTTLRISADRPGATVVVDDVAIGLAPLERPIFVESGSHSVGARLEGFVSAPRFLTTRAGEEVRVDLSLTPQTPARPAAAATTAPEPPRRAKNPWIIGAGAVTGTAVLAVGLGYGVAAVTSDKRVDQHNQNAGVFGTIGGALLAGTIAYALWPTSAPAPQAGHVSAAPVALERGGGFVFAGSL